MHDQQAVCLEVRETQSRFPGTEFSMWRMQPCGNRVAAVARAGEEYGIGRILTPIKDAGLTAASGLGSVLPVLWLSQTSWRKTIRPYKAPNQEKSLHLEHSGFLLAAAERRARHLFPGRRALMAT